MYRFLSVAKNSIFLVAILTNHAAEAGTAKENTKAAPAFFAKSTTDPYTAASTPRRIVSVSRRSVSFYNDASPTKSLDHGHVIGASLMKAKDASKNNAHHSKK